jgi:membrane associated rhomboid family serine protease
MFSERNYNNKYGSKTNYWAVPSIILSCVLVFLFQNMTARQIGYFVHDPVTSNLALNAYGIRSLQLWRLVTYMFVHGGFWHLAINMWGLYLFGSMLERRMGSANFLKLYFISGIVGALLWLAFNWNTPIPCVGASGALFGVMVAAAMMYPNAMIMLLIPPIPLKLKTFVIIYALIESFSSITGVEGQIAHLVHLGGLVGGYFYMRFTYPKETYNVFKFLKLRANKFTSTTHSKSASKNWKFVNSSATNLDVILDKISHSGINSLTEKELEILRKARDKMRNKS